jgi:hypothetical protein
MLLELYLFLALLGLAVLLTLPRLLFLLARLVALRLWFGSVKRALGHIALATVDDPLTGPQGRGTDWPLALSGRRSCNSLFVGFRYRPQRRDATIACGTRSIQ